MGGPSPLFATLSIETRKAVADLVKCRDMREWIAVRRCFVDL